MGDFQKCLAFTLKREGGNVDDKRDRGGRTSRGVTQAVYDAWRARQRMSPRDVWLADQVEIEQIYRAQYWAVVRGDDLPAGVDLAVFDFAVNSGTGRAIKALQRALGVTPDGQIGQLTLAALARGVDSIAVIHEICADRLAFCKSLKDWKYFGNGWANRIRALEPAVVKMAAGPGAVVTRTVEKTATSAASPESASSDPPHPHEGKKARPADAKAILPEAPADAATGAGIATATLSQVIDALTPAAGASDKIQSLIVALTVAGALIAVAGILYKAWASWRNARRAEALA